jgi:hypothetical protein
MYPLQRGRGGRADAGHQPRGPVVSGAEAAAAGTARDGRVERRKVGIFHIRGSLIFMVIAPVYSRSFVDAAAALLTVTDRAGARSARTHIGLR